MGALLSTTSRRADQCLAHVPVSGEIDAVLICDLKRDHPGPLHYDRTDEIWWASGPQEGT
jgi:hypothetical protein